jgi:circadian clock protein KaiB
MSTEKTLQNVKLEIVLYVSGLSVRTDTAIHNLRSFLAENAENDVDLTIVDVLENPQAAEDAQILATPTLIKTSPLPERRTIGDLSDRKSLVYILGIREE